MSSAQEPNRFSVREYLAQEELATHKSEYVDGWIRLMSGATNRHSKVSLNCAFELKRLLKGTHCQTFHRDAKVRIQTDQMNRFYYPDAQVVCDPNPDTDVFHDRPVMIVEVLSPSTRAYDLDEKMKAYLRIPTLKCYLILEQHQPIAIAVYRDGLTTQQRRFEGMDAVIDLPFFDRSLALRDIYEGVEFSSTCVQESELLYEET